MNALEAASLVMIPSGYEDGTLGSLKPTDGTGDFTFSRGSNISATRVTADGNIEKGYENLLLQSNTFDTTWLSVNADTPSGGQIGYDGSNDAWLLNSTGTEGRVTQSISQTGVQSFSVYAKANTNNWICLISLTSPIVRANFDLNPSTTGSRIGVTGNEIDANIEDVGNGWFRCSVTYNATITGVNIYSVVDDNVFTGTGSIYIQDAMINQGMVAYPYVETTTAPVAGGILEDMPRLDYSNGSCPSLLLEPSRTNLVTYSEYIEGLGGDAGLNFNYNNATSPEGLTNAVQAVSNNTGQSYFGYFNGTAPAGDNTFSVFAKYDNCQYICIRILGFTTGDDGYYWFDIQNGTKGSKSGSTITYDIEDYGNGWYRCYVVHNVDAGDVSGAGRVYLCDSDNNLNSALNKAAHLYGLQWELGSFKTSYIPTYGVSQTRLADVLFEGAAGLSNFFNPTEGTLFFEVDEPLFRQLTTDGRSIAMRDTTNGEYFQLRGRSNSVYFLLTMCSPSVVVTTNFQNNTKYVMRWNGSEVKIFANGEARGSATQIDSFRPNTLGVASGFGMYTPTGEKFTNITCFPTALSDEACIELTTI